MQCTRPLRANLTNEGTITFDQKQAVSGLLPFQLPCRKCLPCRLNTGREKAIRAWHEAQQHPENIFLTLTYSDENLESHRLQYEHMQTFMKDLRYEITKSDPNHRIDRMVTGEYGDKNKRPHWHLILFNYSPPDLTYHSTTDRGDRIYTSKLIDSIWGKNDPIKAPSQIGDVTIDSASYIARYAAKKLSHGLDHEHDFNPIHKTPSRRAMGRSWIEKHYKHTFENGFVVLPNGELSKIPRYYSDWAKTHAPKYYEYYVTTLLPQIIAKAETNTEKEILHWLALTKRTSENTRPKVKETILKLKFKRLQERLKL